MEDKEDKFIEQIQTILTKNDFPNKKVALPLAKLQQEAAKNDLDLDMVFDRLEMFDIYHRVDETRVVFASNQIETVNHEEDDTPKKDFSSMLDNLKGMNKEDLLSNVTSMMDTMSDEEKKQMYEMYQNMDEKEKQEIMEKGKDLGLM